jgi:hypothetical protein
MGAIFGIGFGFSRGRFGFIASLLNVDDRTAWISGAPVANAEACCHSAPFDGENSIDKVGDGRDVGLYNHGGNVLLLRFRRILRMRRASTGELATADEVIE